MFKSHTPHWIYACLCGFALTVVVVFLQKTSLTVTSQLVSESPYCEEMLGYWKFDEGTGTAMTDDAPYGNHGDFVQGSSGNWSTETAPQIDFWNVGSLEFTGNNYGAVFTGSQLDVEGDLTVSVWMKYTVLQPNTEANVLIAYGGTKQEIATESMSDNHLYIVNINGVNKKIRMSWENGNDSRDVIVESTAPSAVSSTNWTHIVVTRNAITKQIRFYENGSVLGSAQSYSVLPSGSSGGALFFGAAMYDLSGTYYNGFMDDIRVYGSVLTAEQVQGLYGNADQLAGCTCGNAEIEPPEDCDDGNALNTDACTNSCQVAQCGDGYVQAGAAEECEPPNTSTCSSNCRLIDDPTLAASSSSQSIPEGCGNRILQKENGEECDDGHLNGKGKCSLYCTVLYCGDGILSPEVSEECEPVPVSVVDGTPVFQDPVCGEGCSTKCTRVFLPPCTVVAASSASSSISDDTQLKSAAPRSPQCGNAVVEDLEECDNGSVCSGGENDGLAVLSVDSYEACIQAGGTARAVSNDGCSELCENEWCGDGVIQSNGIDGTEGTKDDEQCDNGSVCTNNPDTACTKDVDCTVEVNGEVKVGRCIFNYEADPLCTNACVSLATCGDGKVESIETCDDGNVESGDGCSATCTDENAPSSTSSSENTAFSVRLIDETRAVCGNFHIEGDEECDDGILNSDEDANACRTDCRAAFCGDGIQDAREACDSGEDNSDTQADTCRNTCTLPFCGDGVIDSGEECDSSENCQENCTYPPVSICGNGILEAHEQCDDGNANESDGCSTLCKANPKILFANSSTSGESSSASAVVAGEATVQSYATQSSRRSMPAVSSDAQRAEIPVAIQSSSHSIFTLQPIQQQVAQSSAQNLAGSIIVTSQHAPLGDTGPAAAILVVSGASAGLLWNRRKKRTTDTHEGL